MTSFTCQIIANLHKKLQILNIYYKFILDNLNFITHNAFMTAKYKRFLHF